MKHSIPYILIPFLLTALTFMGCQGGKNMSGTLTEAEALIYEYPDSALHLLEGISHPERLTGREQADYALLLSLARYRCYIPSTSDSLINIAVHYYGLNQYAESLSAVYRNANRRQSVSIGFRIPVWQWGINRNKRKIAENTYEASLLSLETSIREFEDGIKENIHTYNHSVCLWQLAESSYRLAREQYAVAVKAFALGELSVYELTSARQKQNETMQQYYTAMKDTYSSYFRLRNLSLYDFRTEQDLEDVYLENDE